MTQPERVTLTTSDGIELEARWDGSPAADIAAVFCHPHPRQRGTMNAPLMHKVTRRLTEHNIRVLRFNFRGVGMSKGSWGGGEAEVLDVAAAMERAVEEGVPTALAGWSFGAGVALRWQAQAGDTGAYAGIAPGVLYAPDMMQLAPARRLFILGDRDQLVDVEQVTEYGNRIGARVELVPGSDHFFHFREAIVADLIAGWFLDEHHEGVDQETHQPPDEGAVDPDELKIAPE